MTYPRIFAFRHGLRNLAAALLALGLWFPAAPVRAEEPLSKCVGELWSCAKNVGLTLYHTAEAATNILTYAVSAGPCLAAMASGNPGAIGVTGLVVGLGAAGVVKPSNCENDIYGVAGGPIAEGLDALIPGVGLSKLVAAGDMVGFKSAVGLLPVPFALPPTAGLLIGCGCGALAAGAQAIEDVRKVAASADAAIQSCGSALNSCPGLKQIVAVFKGAARLVKDPSSIVQSCDSMSRGEYVAARLRPAIPGVVEQFRKNIVWTGSGEDTYFTALGSECVSYYSRHCYTDDEAGAFCRGPVFEQNFDPELWAALTAEFTGPQFDAYFSANAAKKLGPGTCPADPAQGAISLDPNASNDQQSKSARSSNTKACAQEMKELLSGEKDSFKQLAFDLLPKTREGWNDTVRFKQTEPPLDNVKKVIDKAMNTAAVVYKVKMAQRSAYFAAQDTEFALSGEKAVVPYTVLNKEYAGWAGGVMLTHMNRCPADASGWAKKFDMQCVQELANRLGFTAQVAYEMKSGDIGSTSFPTQISAGQFKGSAYYSKALAYMTADGKVPRIRVPGESLDTKTERYYNYWKTARQDIINPLLLGDLAGFFGVHQERVAQTQKARSQQNEMFAGSQRITTEDRDLVLLRCQLVRGNPEACKAKVYELAVPELDHLAKVRSDTFAGISSPNLPAAQTKFMIAYNSLEFRHKSVMASYKSLETQFPIDTAKAAAAGVAGGVAGAAGKGANKGASKEDLLALGKAPAKPAAAASGAQGGGAGAPAGAGRLSPEEQAKYDALDRAAKDKALGIVRIGESGKLSDGTVPKIDSKAPAGAQAANFGMRSAPGMVAKTVVPDISNKQGANAGKLAVGLPDTDAADKKAGGPVVPSGAKVVIASAAVAGGQLADISDKLASFDDRAYRIARDKQLDAQWLPACKSPDCPAKVSQLLDQQILREVNDIAANPKLWNDKAGQELLQKAADSFFRVTLIGLVSAPGPTPFREGSYRVARTNELANAWMPKCKVQLCKTNVPELIKLQLNDEVTRIGPNSALWSDGVAQDRMQNTMDAAYAQRYETEVDRRPTAITAIDPGINASIIINKSIKGGAVLRP